jgi:hypothetical protein
MSNRFSNQSNSSLETALTRRDLLRLAAFGLGSAGTSGWMPAFAEALAQNPHRRRHCVLLWMTGGPSQTDTFDMKPGHANGGPFQEIATSVPGLRFSEHLPKLAAHADHLSVIRSLSTREGDHGRGAYLMRTGHMPDGAIRFPTLGSLLSKELRDEEGSVPHFVSIAPFRGVNAAAFEPGFLGPRFAPLVVNAARPQQQPLQPGDGFAELGLDDLVTPEGVEQSRNDGRLALLQSAQQEFLSKHRSGSPVAHNTVLERALRLIHSRAADAFDLSQESAAVRETYGRGTFGQGCLMARRLIEVGVPFVEVSLGDFGRWDTHNDNFNMVRGLSAELDAGWSSLMSDLKDRGLLESTTIVWMGEFGRTPRINGGAGRDHFPNAWSAVLAGGGIKGGQAYGRTSADGMTVEEGRMDVGDLLATVCAALGVNPEQRNVSEVGRPIRIAEGKPVRDVLSGST